MTPAGAEDDSEGHSLKYGPQGASGAESDSEANPHVNTEAGAERKED